MTEAAGMEALNRLKSMEPTLWLEPSESLSQAARTASRQLFSCLKPHVPKCPFDELLVDGFDVEQIWQQIDLQSQPLLSSLRRQVKHWERNPEELGSLFKKNVQEEEKKVLEARGIDDVHDGEEEMDVDDFEEEEEDERQDDDGGEQCESKVEDKGEEGGVEDEFLKIKELQEFLEEDEAREYGLDTKEMKKKKGEMKKLNNEDSEEEEDDDEVEDEEEFGLFDEDDDEDEEATKLGNAKYDDFFVKNKTVSKTKSKLKDTSEESDLGEEQDDEAINEGKGGLSTHEKEAQKRQLEIEKMEKANLEPKNWTMQGEVTAANRPKNSALEVDLDFEHNMRPAPVITEEVTASLEDLIKKRIIEGQFDDIQKVPRLPSKGPRELKELDDNKSKKGLAELYEKEYVEKTNPAISSLSFTDEQKKEASMLFKKLCLKLDALSHFHFAPKPAIEDMSIQANVPALAMEEIAPVAVSDAAMLAPEEVFSGKGDIKEEAELTQAERKRRRANKKRKFKAEAEKRNAKKAQHSRLLNDSDGKED